LIALVFKLGVQEFEVPELAWYGPKSLRLQFPEKWQVSFLPMNGFNYPIVSTDEIMRALKEPIGKKPLARIAKGKKEVVIVIDDMTRTTRAHQIVPPVLEELKRAWVRSDHIRFIMGGGLHGAWYRDDFAKKIGEENVEEFPVYNHNPFGNCEKIGETRKGTPVEINAEYNSCDLRIGIGSVVPHPQAGYGGGAKIILPGISTYQTVLHNHTAVYNQNPDIASFKFFWGFLHGNVMREDIEEAGKLADMDMKIDVLVNGFGDSSMVFAGDLKKEFCGAATYAKQFYSTPNMPKDVDVIIANTYAKANEATLALENWNHRMKKNGVMVIIAHAPEGQITHYHLGKFGRRRTPEVKVSYKVIVFSRHITPDPLLPITESAIWIKNWTEVIEEIGSSFDYEPKVAVLPNSEIQCDTNILKSANRTT
jgi:nickel-dependent lactate racemase